MISLRSLRHFATLVEEGNYTRAAEQLHLTQSALSRSIQSLEQTLGLQLLDRTPNGVVLSSAGQELHAYAIRILRDASAMQREAELLRGYDTGKVSFGIGVFPAAGLLSPLLTRLATRYPRMRVHVEIESWQRLLDKLDRDRLDFVMAVTSSLPPSARYRVRKLPTQSFGLFVRQHHPLLGLTRSKLKAALAKYGLVTTDLPPRARKQLATIYQLDHVDELPITLECDSVEALRNVALSTDTVLFATQEAVQRDIDDGKLHRLPISYFTGTESNCSIVYKAHRTLTPAAETVIATIIDLLASQPAPAHT